MLINEHDVLTLKKAHACGGDRFTAVKSGADVKLQCLKCGHVVNMDLNKLLKRIKNKESANGQK